jgi:pimeloyl-ACP methyl ester carboxylesterase
MCSMTLATVDGIPTRYEVVGEGTPVLMFSPGGFDSSLDSWRSVGVYRRLGLVDALAQRHRLILFDRRESGQSGGRIERLGWAAYVRQALGLLDLLGVESAHVMGGCIGCSTAALLAISHPDRVDGMVLYSPAGGPRYRLAQHQRFARHAAYVLEHGPASVVELARSTAEGFSVDPRVGPWASALRNDDELAARFAGLDSGEYAAMLAASVRVLFDRDTVPGPEPEDLFALRHPALIVPGDDRSHTRSAARYLQECLPVNEYWDAPVAEQTAQTAPARILAFLAGVDGRRAVGDPLNP